MSEVHKLPEATSVMFFKTDDAIGFGYTVFRPDLLVSTVTRILFGDDQVLDDEQRRECHDVADMLASEGAIDFEDGWLQIATTPSTICAAFMERCRAAKEDERHADQKRYDQMKRADTAEKRYADLVAALLDALGPNSEVLAARLTAA